MDYSLLMGVHNLDSPSTSIVRFTSFNFLACLFLIAITSISRSLDNLHLWKPISTVIRVN